MDNNLPEANGWFGWIASGVALVIAYFAKDAHNSLRRQVDDLEKRNDEQADELTELKLHIANDYVKRADLEEIKRAMSTNQETLLSKMDRMTSQIGQVGEKLENKVNELGRDVYKQLATKQDKAR